MTIEEKLTQLQITLPAVPPAAGNYLPYVRTGNLIYLAGVLSMKDGVMTHTGQVGGERDVAYGYDAARVCALNALANLRAAAGSLEKIRRIVFVSGYVNGVAGFADSPAVINGASDLFVEVMGDVGRHARAAVAVAGLPKNAAVEIQVVAELAD